MPLADLWVTSPDQLEDKHAQQVIAFAGAGKLADGNLCSSEFRDFLSLVPSRLLRRYVDDCLGSRFEDGGRALQDVVNELGHRLGLRVTNGRYRGVQNQIGFDGLWQNESGHTVIVETKTTDTYRIDLGAISGYRRALAARGELIESESSILIVVGRSDTGDLEAQIRGSRYAWDIRLISVDGLLKLVDVKERIDRPDVVRKVWEVLIPREFTRLDGIIDLVFSTAEEVREAVEEEEVLDSEDEERVDLEKAAPVGFHEESAERVQSFLKRPLVRASRTTYRSPDGSLLVVCLVSRQYESGRGKDFWFGFHPYQKDALEDAPQGLVALGCGSPSTVLLIPIEEFREWLPGMHTTHMPTRMYWHVNIFREDGGMVLHRRAGHDRIDLSKYLIPQSH